MQITACISRGSVSGLRFDCSDKKPTFPAEFSSPSLGGVDQDFTTAGSSGGVGLILKLQEGEGVVSKRVAQCVFDFKSAQDFWESQSSMLKGSFRDLPLINAELSPAAISSSPSTIFPFVLKR